MPRLAGLLMLMLTGTVLAGCVYDPYTGLYRPCCGYYGYYGYYGNPYYRYPPYPYGYSSGPYGAPPQGQPGGYPPPPGQPPSGPYGGPPQSQPGAYPRPGAAASPAEDRRFAAAGVTRDGPLTGEPSIR